MAATCTSPIASGSRKYVRQSEPSTPSARARRPAAMVQPAARTAVSCRSRFASFVRATAADAPATRPPVVASACVSLTDGCSPPRSEDSTARGGAEVSDHGPARNILPAGRRRRAPPLRCDHRAPPRGGLAGRCARSWLRRAGPVVGSARLPRARPDAARPDDGPQSPDEPDRQRRERRQSDHVWVELNHVHCTVLGGRGDGGRDLRHRHGGRRARRHVRDTVRC